MEGQYSTCRGKMKIKSISYKNEVWHSISDGIQPTRWVRLFKKNALEKLIKNYAYMDSDKCVNTKKVNWKTKTQEVLKSEKTLDSLDDSHRNIKGVAQRTYNSGLCWYCALCFVMFFSKQMRKFVSDYMTATDNALCTNVLNDAKCAEALRHHLYHVYKMGDRPGQAPELDGQNGFSQFCILAAKLNMPVIRLFAPKMQEITEPVMDQSGKWHNLRNKPKQNESSMLCVRCFRTKWSPSRRIIHNKKRYKLVALLIGSEHCGHQVGVSTCDMRICRWAHADSDAAQHGIGPIFWRIAQEPNETRAEFKRRWRESWEHMVPVTIFGNNEYCDLNPVNRPTHELERFAKAVNHSQTPGVVNTDYIYLHIPD